MAVRTRRLALVFLLLLLLPACWVYSVHPLVADDDELAFDKELLGAWSDASGCALTFSRFFDEKMYRVVYAAPPAGPGGGCLIDRGQTAAFDGRMIEIGHFRFLDLFPVDRESRHHQIRLHSFYRIKVEREALQLTPLNLDWLRQQVREHRLSLEGRDDADQAFVLTSITKDLQDFLRAYGGSEEAFSSARRLNFQRRREP